MGHLRFSCIKAGNSHNETAWIYKKQSKTCFLYIHTVKWMHIYA